jgi:hypothetical protein
MDMVLIRRQFEKMWDSCQFPWSAWTMSYPHSIEFGITNLLLHRKFDLTCTGPAKSSKVAPPFSRWVLSFS